MASLAAEARTPVSPVDRFFEFALLGMLASGSCAIAGSGYLDGATIALSLLSLLLRALLVAGIVRLTIPSSLVAAATLLYIGFFPLDYLFVSGEFMPATVHLLFYLGATKVLTAATDRDYFFVKIIAFLQLLAATVLSASINFLLFLGLFLLCGVAAFSSGEIRRGLRRAPGSRVTAPLDGQLAIVSVGVFTGILVLTGALFFLLPRTARAALSHFVPQQLRVPGFSNEVALGQLGRLTPQDTPVLHVRMLTGERPPNTKWRGAALAQFDGRRWSNPLTGPAALEDLLHTDAGLARLTVDQRPSTARRISYEVQVKTAESDELFFAGIPEMVELSARYLRRTRTDSFRLGFGMADSLRYTASSFLMEGRQMPTLAPLPGGLRPVYLALPSLDPRVAALAREVTAGLSTDGQRAYALEQYLQTQYGYTLDLLDQEVTDPLAHFLFTRRKGHCEYFASAMAVMLRTLGIPSRLVTGFQSGVYNTLSGRQVIRSSDAHSWVEAYLPGQGWYTFDPTPVDQRTLAPSWWAGWALYLDAAETVWQDWVINYDLERQWNLATQLERSQRREGLPWWKQWSVDAGAMRRQFAAAGREHAGTVVGGLLLILVPALGGPLFWKRVKDWHQLRRLRQGRAAATDASLLYGRMLQLLRHRGIEKPAWLTPTEFAAVLPASELAGLVWELTTAYNALRFGQQPEAALQIVRLLRQIEHAA